MCRDYCTVTWNEALNSVGVPADSELRRAERVYFLEHIREIPTDPSSVALPLPSFEQVPNTQDLTIDVGTSTGAGMGKEGLPPTSDALFEDTLTIRDVISQAKVAEKPKDGDARSKIATTKEDPHPKKSNCRILLFLFSLPEIFVACNIFLKLMNKPFLYSPNLYFCAFRIYHYYCRQV